MAPPVTNGHRRRRRWSNSTLLSTSRATTRCLQTPRIRPTRLSHIALTQTICEPLRCSVRVSVCLRFRSISTVHASQHCLFDLSIDLSRCGSANSRRSPWPGAQLAPSPPMICSVANCWADQSLWTANGRCLFCSQWSDAAAPTPPAHTARPHRIARCHGCRRAALYLLSTLTASVDHQRPLRPNSADQLSQASPVPRRPAQSVRHGDKRQRIMQVSAWTTNQGTAKGGGGRGHTGWWISASVRLPASQLSASVADGSGRPLFLRPPAHLSLCHRTVCSQIPSAIQGREA